jgi:hypothetical protein
LGVENEGIKKTVKRGARGAQAAVEHGYDQAMKSGGRLVESMKGHGAGKALAIGAGVAVTAGLLLGSMHSPREGQALTPSHESVNAHRPEDRIGVNDSIPGEPVTGSMAPSRPVRTIRQAPQGVQTAVVAPMHAHTNTEVRMRSNDRSRAAEMARMASRLAGRGSSNTVINYRNTKSGSLRTRDKINDSLNDQ